MAFECSGKAFIKVYRKFLEWEWYSDVNTSRLFLHCLLKANWKAGRWHGINIEPGQFPTSLQSLADETCLTVRQVRVALDHLKMTGEVSVKRHSKCSVITINNWDGYQGSDKQNVTQMTAKRQTECHDDGTKTTTLKEYKEDKNINNNNIKFVPPTVDEVRAYCLERKNNVDPESFVSFYESKGWMIGKNKMKDWKAAVRTWEQKEKEKPATKKGKFDNFNQRKYDFDELMKGAIT